MVKIIYLFCFVVHKERNKEIPFLEGENMCHFHLLVI